jgi:hypothetical protein
VQRMSGGLGARAAPRAPSHVNPKMYNLFIRARPLSCPSGESLPCKPSRV